MASHDLSNTRTTILGATPGAIPGIEETHMKDFHLALHSGVFGQELGRSPRAREEKKEKDTQKVGLSRFYFWKNLEHVSNLFWVGGIHFLVLRPRPRGPVCVFLVASGEVLSLMQ